MTARDFAFWLQGFFEITSAAGKDNAPLSAQQTDLIRRHLSLVFLHEIDPSMGDKAHQTKLDEAHHGPTAAQAAHAEPWHLRPETRHSGPVMRC